MPKDGSSLVSANNYKFKKWGKQFPDYEIDLLLLIHNSTWKKIFKKQKDLLKDIAENLEVMLKKTKGKIEIFPYPDLVFNAFNQLDFTDVKVVFMGMDPYINKKLASNSSLIPEAMGMCFSVPIGIPLPPSLKNIYKNLIKYKHINKE